MAIASLRASAMSSTCSSVSEAPGSWGGGVCCAATGDDEARSADRQMDNTRDTSLDGAHIVLIIVLDSRSGGSPGG
jgi:hypothetical protein